MRHKEKGCFCWGGDATKHFSVKKKGFQWKGGEVIQWVGGLVRISTGKAIQWRGPGHSVNRRTLKCEKLLSSSPSQKSALNKEKGVLSKGISEESIVRSKKPRNTQGYWTKQYIWHSERQAKRGLDLCKNPPSKHPPLFFQVCSWKRFRCLGSGVMWRAAPCLAVSPGCFQGRVFGASLDGWPERP